MATKAPLFHVRISPGGAQKQGVRLHLMRKGLHTPLVILSTWNPGHSGSEEKRPAGLSVRNGNRKCAGWVGERACRSDKLSMLLSGGN